MMMLSEVPRIHFGVLASRGRERGFESLLNGTLNESFKRGQSQELCTSNI
jgi:hypothetical protein